MRADQVSSLSLKIWTTPFFAEAARIYSESVDQPMLDIELSAEDVFGRGNRMDWDGLESSVHDLDTWNEIDLRTTSLSCIAVRINWAPGLNATRDPDCL
jgi:hypothetical protein